jgi:hypothetical protein
MQVFLVMDNTGLAMLIVEIFLQDQQNIKLELPVIFSISI